MFAKDKKEEPKRGKKFSSCRSFLYQELGRPEVADVFYLFIQLNHPFTKFAAMKKICFFFTSCFIALAVFSQVPATTKEAFFKDWNYGPTGVFGIVKLDNLTERSYYKIVKTDIQTTKVYSYNAMGVQTNMVTVRFGNGKITQLARTDRWGDTYEVTK